MQKISLVLILIFAFALRIPFFSIPLDYDEGTYAFFAFFSHGEKLYSTLPLLKLPGIIFTYRFLDDMFPGNIVAFRVAAAILIVMATFGIYKLGCHLYNHRMALLSALIFAIFSPRISQDSPANTEFFMMPFMVLSAWSFWVFQKSKKTIWLILSGVLAGVAVFYKQVAIFEVAFLALWLFSTNFKKGRLQLATIIKEWLIFGVGVLLPLLIAIIYFIFKGELTDFWWQSFGSGSSYARYAWGDGEWFRRVKMIVSYLWREFWPFLVVAAGGLVSVLLNRKKKETIFLAGLLAFSFIGASFNGWFFPHYFIQIIPVLSLLGGLFLDILIRQLSFLGIFAVAVFLFLTLTPGQSRYLNYLKMVSGKIDKNVYLQNLTFDVGEAGWLPFYDSAGYLKSKLKEKDSIFVWSGLPLSYYLTRKYPTTSFVYNYPLLNYQLMMASIKGWKFDFEDNRQKLMKELTSSPPTYILVHVAPEQIFDQMFLFRDFPGFVDQNYETENKFGNILVFKLSERKKSTDLNRAGLPVIPLELVKRFAAVTNIEIKNKETEITFEPMVNPGGVLREFKVIYPEIITIDFAKITVKFLGQDGGDFVGAGSQGPSGVPDLHFQIKEVGKPISFIRVKSDKITWNSQSYGVNLMIQVIRSNNSTDLYLEPPSDWKKRKFEVYIIYQDGTLAQGEIKWE